MQSKRIKTYPDFLSSSGQTAFDILVLDARERQSLVTIRALGRQGLQVAALESRERLPAPAFASRWCRCQEISLGHEGTEAYFLELVQVLERTKARVVIPSSDGTITLLRRHRLAIEKRVALTLAKEAALDIAVDKEKTLEIASRLGLAVPRAVHVHTLAELCEALREIGLPAVAKPAMSWMDNGQTRVRLAPTLVTTPDEAKKVAEEILPLGGTVLFQQYLAGERESMHFMYAGGQMYARFAQWAKRTYPLLGGASVLRCSIAIPSDIGAQSERLVREIDLEGYSEVEFRRSSDGIPYLMEINPRLSASIELAVSSGVNFPHLLYQWATGEHIDVVKDYVLGRWMRYLSGDILVLLTTLRDQGRPEAAPRGQALSNFCTAFLHPTYYDYLDWGDLAPAYVATTSFTRRMAQLATIRLASIGLNTRKTEPGMQNGKALPMRRN